FALARVLSLASAFALARVLGFAGTFALTRVLGLAGAFALARVLGFASAFALARLLGCGGRHPRRVARNVCGALGISERTRRREQQNGTGRNRDGLHRFHSPPSWSSLCAMILVPA